MMKNEMKNETNENKGYTSTKVGNTTFFIHELWGGKFRVYARGGVFKPNSRHGVWELPSMEAVQALLGKFEKN